MSGFIHKSGDHDRSTKKRRHSTANLSTTMPAETDSPSRLRRSSSFSSLASSSSFPSTSSSNKSSFTSSTSSMNSLRRSSSLYSMTTTSSSSSDSSIVLLSAALVQYAKRRVKKRRTRRKLFTSVTETIRRGVNFREIVNALGPEKFKKSYRMSLPTFKLLLNDVRDLLQRPFKIQTEYRRATVPPEIRLAITLRILGGGSYLDIMLAYGVQETTVRHIFHTTCTALSSRLHLKGFPATIEGMQEIARRFQTSRKGTNPLPGCVGALDGICIKIMKPKRHENPALFYCRKGFYAVPVQALVDSDYIFRFCSAVCTGATHDSLAYSVSGLKEAIDKGALFGIFYVVGDDAYCLSNELITPCSRSSADVDQDNFNYFHSSLRIHVEQAFGMLVSRWRILRGTLQFSVTRSTRIVCLLMKLHNFILENDRSRSFIVYGLSEGERSALEADVNRWCRDSRRVAREFLTTETGHRDHDGVLATARAVHASDRRNMLIEIVRRRGREGPAVPLLPYQTAIDPF